MTETRVSVRAFRELDILDFLYYQGLPAVRRYQPGPAMTRAQASAFVTEQTRRRSSERGVWHGRVVELIAERKVIGDVGLWVPDDVEAATTGDLGFQFSPRYHGRGLALEALETFLPTAVPEFGLDRITATCRDSNRSSWRLLERLGMGLEARDGHERRYAINTVERASSWSQAPVD